MQSRNNIGEEVLHVVAVLGGSVGESNCGQIRRMVDIAAGSAKLSVNLPELNRRFKYDVLDIVGSCSACGLVFYVDVMSITLNTNNLVSRSPLQIPFAWLFIFKIYTISNIEGWVVSGGSVLRGCEPVFIQCFLCYC